MSKRLQTLLDKHNVISECQIGFRKNRRTSDHIFILKCILEESKRSRKPIFGCFVDLKKCFDTVWITGLLYKMANYYNISPKFNHLIRCMYSNTNAKVKSNGQISPSFLLELARAAILARYYSTFLLMICLSYYMKGNAIQYLCIHARSIF